jgi:hypothetical protein
MEVDNLAIARINFARKMGSRIGGFSPGNAILVDNEYGLALAR